MHSKIFSETLWPLISIDRLISFLKEVKQEKLERSISRNLRRKIKLNLGKRMAWYCITLAKEEMDLQSELPACKTSEWASSLCSQEWEEREAHHKATPALPQKQGRPKDIPGHEGQTSKLTCISGHICVQTRSSTGV